MSQAPEIAGLTAPDGHEQEGEAERPRRAVVSRNDAGDVAGCGKLYKARYRLYRSQTLQENSRLKALAEIYTIHSFTYLCNLNFLSKFARTIQKIKQNV